MEEDLTVSQLLPVMYQRDMAQAANVRSAGIAQAMKPECSSNTAACGHQTPQHRGVCVTFAPGLLGGTVSFLNVLKLN
jgi:hypothetical protein